ncbi:hypothetical protein ACOXXX_04255 [Thalassococcus sp. BH17M4-6]|uniref:hypothetical protein n=1 Tax=Thalassococcus sp. BH17M4-6 TaxID=3413148 RepID=UPI003BBC0CEF
MTDDQVIATITASAPRRVIGVSALTFLGALLIYMAFAAPPALIWQLFLIAMGAGALWLASFMWQATAASLELTETELRDTSGMVLARIADVESVSRGAFAMKPSNGFTLKTNRPQARCWRPGLWWRTGRMVAIGGVTSGAATKPVADMIAAMVAERQAD